MPDDVKALIERIERLDRSAKQQIFEAIKNDIIVHALEDHFGTSVQIICEAILRAGDLTQRGIRGVIAETIFSRNIVPTIPGWQDTTPAGDHPYDVLLTNQKRQVRIQVKLQRKQKGEPLMRAKTRHGPKEFYIVEVQRTRTGNRDGALTRPYRFNEFDLLAVCMQPSTGEWRNFLYTPTQKLQPKKIGDLLSNAGEQIVQTFQFVPPYPAENDENWTNSIDFALKGFDT